MHYILADGTEGLIDVSRAVLDNPEALWLEDSNGALIQKSSISILNLVSKPSSAGAVGLEAMSDVELAEQALAGPQGID